MHRLNAGKLLTALALATVSTACATKPEIRADSDPSVNLSEYKTYGFFQQLATDKAGAPAATNYSTMISTRLKDATRREMEKRGYAESNSSPQLLINFNTNVENRTDVRSTGTTADFYGYRAGFYGAWAGYPQDVYTTHYQQGTLAIDIVDASRKQLIWQGVAQARLTKAMLDKPNETIDKIVVDIFKKYPIAPATTAEAK